MSRDDLDDRARAIYNQSPALTPFSRKPIPYESAARHGLNSWARARTIAMTQVLDEAGEIA